MEQFKHYPAQTTTMIELLTSSAYSLVEASWHTSAVLVKFYLVFSTARLYRRGLLEEEKLDEVESFILEESKVVLAVILGIGGLTALTGFELRPRFELLSELSALIYLGYLFWKF